eukprot:4488559-Amphidinium_carterae.1
MQRMQAATARMTVDNGQVSNSHLCRHLQRGSAQFQLWSHWHVHLLPNYLTERGRHLCHAPMLAIGQSHRRCTTPIKPLKSTRAAACKFGATSHCASRMKCPLDHHLASLMPTTVLVGDASEVSMPRLEALSASQ